MLRKCILVIIGVAVVITFAFAQYGQKGKKPAEDIPTVAQKAGQFKTLVTALQTVGLVDTLKGKGPFTVFAPTDEAFAKVPKETLEELLKPENKEKLRSILLYHVVAGKYISADVKKLKSGTQVETLLKGKKITIAQKRDGIYINDAKVVKTDVLAKNGVIHVIDKVILPPEN